MDAVSSSQTSPTTDLVTPSVEASASSAPSRPTAEGTAPRPTEVRDESRQFNAFQLDMLAEMNRRYKIEHVALKPLPQRTSRAIDDSAHDLPPTSAAAPPEPTDLSAPLQLSGVRTHPVHLFKLAGTMNDTPSTLMIDSGASSEFIDPDFARRCGLTLTPSDRTVILANGASAKAIGQVSVTFWLTAAHGKPAVPFTATFTATPLVGYDAILGLTWLERHDVSVGWKNRTVEVHMKGQPTKLFRTIECIGEGAGARLASLTTRGLAKAHRRREVEEVYALFVQPEPVVATEPPEHPAMASLLKEFGDVFPDKLPYGVPPTRGVMHRIELKDGARPPPSRPLRHQSSKDLAVFEEYTRTMIESGQIRPSTSPYGAMALIVRKKDGTARVVIDYRGLNEITVKNKYPLPLMDELFDRVHGAKYYSKLDLRTGFHQIAIHEDDTEKTAFRTRYGSFEYRVLPMGLCNAPGTFMQLMNDTFRDLLDKSVLVFLDDILVFSDTLAEHAVHVRQVLERLRGAKLYAKLSKCQFFRQEVEFLGHHIGAAGLSVMQDKISAVREWPVPRDVSDVRSFLGLAGFYRRFVKGFSEIALPITELTKTVTGAPFAWGDRQDTAFTRLKDALCAAPVLLIADPSLEYTVNCDACDYAIGATLQQNHGNGLQPVAYYSRKLTPAEKNYDTREKEFLALVEACRHWRPYLHSERPFKLLTDHDSLKYHMTMPNLAGRIARWIERMAEFNYSIEHISGVKNVTADALSRRADYKEQHLSVLRLRPRVIAPAVNAALQRIANRAAAELVVPPAGALSAPDAHGVIRMPSQVCTAETRSGTPCKARTAMGQYCWNHLRSVKGLRVMTSSIPHAGKGLHAARDLPAAHRIDYTGDRIAIDDHSGGSYYLELSRSTAIDAARTNCGEGRWINDPRGSALQPNCEFRVWTPPGRPRIGCVRTLRPIKKGEELLIRYGAAYWNYHNRGQVRKRGRAAAAENLAAIGATPAMDATLSEDILLAAESDTMYTARLESPPANTTVHHGLLWEEGTDRLHVPDDAPLRTRILAHCHDDITGAHFGRDKTLAAVQQRFIWHGLAKAVEEYVATCDSCQRNKPSQRLTPGALMPLAIPGRVGQEWSQDAVTGLPTTRRGHDAIQVYVERLTKVKHFHATHKADGAAELISSFIHTVVRPHGVPEAVVSDRDPRFTAHYYAELTKLLGIKLNMSTARHPQSDGQTEREIRTLVTALRAYCNENQDDWDDHLDMLELGFNCAVQASTQRSPYELLYGQKPRLPIDAALVAIAPRNPAAIDRAHRMTEALDFAREHLEKAQQRQVRNADRREASLSVGDEVLLSTEGLLLRDFASKLTSRYVGPFVVTAEVNRNAYTVALPPQLRALHSTFNIDRLKLYRRTEAFPTRPLQFDRPPPAVDADTNGDQLWAVERITAQKFQGKRRRYLVLWEGYPAEESTWQTRAELEGAEEKLREWEESQLRD
jgi:transposase InsO family protein